MEAKTIVVVMAVAGLFASAGASANESFEYGMDKNSIISGGPSSVSESPDAMSTLLSLDNQTGGYKGWGPMPNPMTALSINESNPSSAIEEERAHRVHVAEVQSYRDQVWMANAPLRAEDENIGATRNRAGGFGRFFGR